VVVCYWLRRKVEAGPWYCSGKIRLHVQQQTTPV
jgi:hypothetical protein